MPASQYTHPHNLDATQVGMIEFLFSDGAKTAAEAAAKGFKDFGNINGIEIQPEDEELAHIGSYRGVRKTDKKVTTRSDLKYLLRTDELDVAKLQFPFFAEIGANWSQGSIAGLAGSPFPFSAGNPSVVGMWYPIKNAAGAHVRRLTDLTAGTNSTDFDNLVEGTDWRADLFNGFIQFLTVQNVNNVTPKITAPALSNAFKTMTPLKRTKRSGIARLRCYDNYVQQGASDVKSNLLFEHVDFGCDLTIEGNLPIDGEQWTELSLMAQVTDPAGEVHHRE